MHGKHCRTNTRTHVRKHHFSDAYEMHENACSPLCEYLNVCVCCSHAHGLRLNVDVCVHACTCGNERVCFACIHMLACVLGPTTCILSAPARSNNMHGFSVAVSVRVCTIDRFDPRAVVTPKNVSVCDLSDCQRDKYGNECVVVVSSRSQSD